MTATQPGSASYILRSPGVDVTDQTVKLSRYVSTLLNFAPRPIGSPARGAGSFAAVGLNIQISAL